MLDALLDSVMVTDLREQEPPSSRVDGDAVWLELSSPVMSLISNVHYTLCVIGVVSHPLIGVIEGTIISRVTDVHQCKGYEKR